LRQERRRLRIETERQRAELADRAAHTRTVRQAALA
jgi:hypothetical protein